MKITLERRYHKLKPGIYTVDERLAKYLLDNDYAKEYTPPYETKEEKFIPQVKSVRQLDKDAPTMTTEELKEIAINDQRTSAVKIAEKELAKR